MFGNAACAGLPTRNRLGNPAARMPCRPLHLPAAGQAAEPFGIGGLVVARHDDDRGALDDGDLLRVLGEFGDALDRGGGGADDRHSLAGESGQAPVFVAAGVVVVPAAGVDPGVGRVGDPQSTVEELARLLRRQLPQGHQRRPRSAQGPSHGSVPPAPSGRRNPGPGLAPACPPAGPRAPGAATPGPDPWSPASRRTRADRLNNVPSGNQPRSRAACPATTASAVLPMPPSPENAATSTACSPAPDESSASRSLLNSSSHPVNPEPLAGTESRAVGAGVAGRTSAFAMAEP